ncbi:hypothetical protein G3N30_05590 [Microbacterium lacticum]|uniref:hypothetical protein n=1 Tax=Microbacterium lacticum TaxID=33885 RepID=UPI0018B0A8C6|nr:hypothetical protein [Microbacterium lacticum]MBF9335727.1 hypothetical protein [Microbacterium lacticum]
MTASLVCTLALVGCASQSVDGPSSPATPTASAAAQAEAPASCADLDVSGVISGASLGTWFSDSLQLAGTLRSTQFRGDTVTGHADVVLGPSFEIASTSNADGVTLEARYVDGTTWADLGSGWIRGDATSSDPEEVIVAEAGSVALAMSSPEAFAAAIASCPTWHSTAPETLQTEGGPQPDARTIECDGTLTLAGIDVTDAAVYFSEDWMPLGTRGTGSFMGVTTPFAAHYYDHGAPIDIEPPH